MRRQQQHPSSGSPPQAIGLQRAGRVMIPAPANDNAQPAAARAALLAIAVALLAVAGWAAARLFG